MSGLSDWTRRYVWAVAVYNDGRTKKSKNYREVYTKHEHSTSCYSPIASYNSLEYSSTTYSSERFQLSFVF